MNLESYDTGSANPTINRNLLHPVRTVWPPLTEQVQIADYLTALEKQIDTVSKGISKAIDALQEYRATLLADAVTGKIDVRSLAKEREVA
jgi:type I restriction enzyme S subunit